jgi:hypothetical protein
LRSGAGIVVGPHDHRERRRLQVKERVDAARPRNDRDRSPRLQQLDPPQSQIADPEVRRDRPHILELEVRVDARSGQHMKRTGELVLVNVGRPVQPEQDLDAEPRNASMP